MTGYACKGNESIGSLVDLFNDMRNDADEAKILMHKIVDERDISAVKASHYIDEVISSRVSVYRDPKN